MTEKRTMLTTIAAALCIMTAGFLPAETQDVDLLDRERREDVLAVSTEVFEQLLARHFHRWRLYAMLQVAGKEHLARLIEPRDEDMMKTALAVCRDTASRRKDDHAFLDDVWLCFRMKLDGYVHGYHSCFNLWYSQLSPERRAETDAQLLKQVDACLKSDKAGVGDQKSQSDGR